jgi:hypothetical protein
LALVPAVYRNSRNKQESCDATRGPIAANPNDAVELLRVYCDQPSTPPNPCAISLSGLYCWWQTAPPLCPHTHPPLPTAGDAAWVGVRWQTLTTSARFHPCCRLHSLFLRFCPPSSPLLLTVLLDADNPSRSQLAEYGNNNACRWLDGLCRARGKAYEPTRRDCPRAWVSTRPLSGRLIPMQNLMKYGVDGKEGIAISTKQGLNYNRQQREFALLHQFPLHLSPSPL